MSLTKYPQGSVRELWTVSFPLMLSSLSLLAMLFCDRLFLAHYNAQAMSATVTAGSAAWAILGSFLIFASMAEVFVAQYNGAKLYNRIGTPVWQMLWFSCAMLLVLVPLALWGGRLIFHGSPNIELEEIYFRYLLLFGVSFPIQGALAAFFVGRGKTRLVMLLAFWANVVNVLLDWLLIFGVEGWLEPMGIKGAAIATCFGNILQAAILAALFLRKEMRDEFGTGRIGIEIKEMVKCLRVGAPQAFLLFVECIGWSFFYKTIALRGREEIFIMGIAQSIIILFMFAAEGIGRGAAAICGNLIGEGRAEESFKVFRSGLTIHLAFFAISSLLFLLYPQLLMNFFMSENLGFIQEGGAGGGSLSSANIKILASVLQLSLFYLIFEGVRWLISGILSAAGDTLYLLVVGTLTVPLCLLLPNYFFVGHGSFGVIGAIGICIAFSCVVSSLFLWRLFGRRWQRINLLT